MKFVSRLSKWFGPQALLLVVLLSGAAGHARAEGQVVQGGFSELHFSGDGPAPVAWIVCERACADSKARRAVVFGPGDGGLRFSGVAGKGFVTAVDRSGERVRVTVTSGGQQFVYSLSNRSAAVELSVPHGVSFELAGGAAFVPAALPGFGEIYSRVRAVQVTPDGQHTIDESGASSETVALAAGQAVWTGVRNRYWAVLAQPQGEASATVRMPQPNRPVVGFSGSDDYRLYAGPVEWQSLRQVAPELSGMLFAALWDFLRALTFGMMMLYDLIAKLIGNPGLAVVLLSLSVKVLMSPLTMLADRWQREVNATHSLLKPELDAIRREFTGEEAHRRILAVYQRHNISPFYTFKSAAGFLIQIPVFIAAFDMLAENFALNGVSFLWIADLAKPDHFAVLPVTLPFFGGYLNLLPFLMTFLSVLAAWLQREETLSPELQRQQSLRLYALSVAFFVLFYTFPAGMVLYWTSSNLFHLLKVESGRLFMRQ